MRKQRNRKLPFRSCCSIECHRKWNNLFVFQGCIPGMEPSLKKKSRSTKNKDVRSLLSVDPGFAIQSHRPLILLVLLTLLLKSLIFAPINFWPLSFICLVPWLIMVGASAHAPRVYFYSFILGLAFFLINMRWMYVATGLGYFAFSFYLAAYFPLVACPLRHIVRRRRWPLAITLPLIWTGSEMLRAVAISGFPWFFLSHSLYKELPFIQISDLLGAYGVTFIIAAVNGGIADILIVYFASRKEKKPAPLFPRIKRSIAIPLALVAVNLIYGYVQLNRDTISQGPKIAVIQGDHLMSVTDSGMPEPKKLNLYLSILKEATREKPDIYLFPESPWMMYLNPEARDLYPISRRSYKILRDHAIKHSAYVITGSGSWEQTPDDLLAKDRRYNSATVFKPDGSEPDRYDKVHLVYFGEEVPFRFGRLRFLYLLFNRFMPWSGPDGDQEYSLFRGDGFKVFSMNPASNPDQTYRFGIPICYEDVMPYVSREFVCGGSSEKRADLLLNISNDGWFGRGLQQPQHLATCVFRAVENRVGIARAVNTGVSGFIQPSGLIHDTQMRDPSSAWPGDHGFAVAHVGVDSRFTIYSQYGDWFAWMCVLVWTVFFVDYWVVRARTLGEK